MTGLEDPTDFRQLLSAAADDAPASSHFLAEDVITAVRTRRRRQRIAGAALAVVAAVAVGVPTVARLTGDSPTPGPVDTSLVDRGAVDVLAGPTRGGLATDTALIQALVDRPWPAADGSQTPEVAERAVAYVDDIGDRRVAALTAYLNGQRLLWWLTGPAGAPADQLQPASPVTGVAPDQPITRLDTSTTPATLVVLAAPGDQVLLSPAVTVDADGELARVYQPLATSDGAAAALVDTITAYGVAASVRVDRGPLTVWRAAPSTSTLPDPISVDPALVPVPAGDPEVPGALLDRFRDDLAQATGLDPDGLQIAARWSGSVPSGDGERPAAVLTATYPSGAVAVAGGWGDEESSGYCTFAFLPAGTDPADVPIAMTCQLDAADNTSPPVTSLLVLGATEDEASWTRADGTATTIQLPARPDPVVLDEPAPGEITLGGMAGPVPVSPFFAGDLGRYGNGPQ